MSIILSVDDKRSILEVRLMVLKQAGYEVLNAADGLEELRIFDSRAVDLVLLDYYMTKVDVQEVAMQMKRKQPYVPVVMVSASLDCFERLRDKVGGFIVKATDPNCCLQKSEDSCRETPFAEVSRGQLEPAR